MTPQPEMILYATAIGIGATLALDLWGLLLKRLFGVSSMGWHLVGRWVGHFPRGRFRHDSIMAAPAVQGELAIGWIVHYLVGIAYAILFLAIVGNGWLQQPTLLPALGFGVLTVIAPFFIMQPGMGAGIAASRTPAPNAARLRSLAAHSVFGIGLYAAARLLAVMAAA